MARRFFTARSIRRFFTARSIRILVLLNRRRIRWLVAILGVSVLLLACVLIFPSWLYPSLHSAELVGLEPVERVQAQAERLKLQNDVRTTLLQGVAGLAILAGGALAWRQLQVTREGQITERYTRAIDQLGRDEPEIVLGAIYALERIARDSAPDRIPVGEVLAAYIRRHAPWPPQPPAQLESDAAIEQLPPLRERAPTVQAALTVLGRSGFGAFLAVRKGYSRSEFVSLEATPGDPYRSSNIFEIPGYLTAGRRDLARTDLRRAELAGAELQYANLAETHLEAADMTGAHLPGANLARANLTGANLRGAKLWHARVNRATRGVEKWETMPGIDDEVTLIEGTPPRSP